MSKAEDIKWTEGMDVYTQHRGGWGNERAFKRDKIAKVYKSGRFVLESDIAPKTQYWCETRKTYLDRLPYTCASKGYTWVYPVTPETTAYNEALIKCHDMENRYRAAREKLPRRISGNEDFASNVVEIMEKIIAQIEPPQSPNQ